MRVFASKGKIERIYGPLNESLTRCGMEVKAEDASGVTSEIIGMEIASRFVFSGKIAGREEFGWVDGYRSSFGKMEWALLFIYCTDSEEALRFIVSAIKDAAKSAGGKTRPPEGLE